MEQKRQDRCLDDEQHIRATEFKNSGNEKFNMKNYKGAIIEYRKGLLHELKNPDLHTNLSAAYLHLDRYFNAEEHAVFAIYLRPNFHKGYIRAAKAACGKGMTTLALKRLNKGLCLVDDPIGVKELKKLKIQYTAFLSLPANAEQEMDFGSNEYLSEEGDNDSYSDDDFHTELPQPTCAHNNPLQNECEQCGAEDNLRTMDLIQNQCDDSASEKSIKWYIEEETVCDYQKEPQKYIEEIMDDSEKELSNSEKHNNNIMDQPDTSEDKQSNGYLQRVLELVKDPDLSKHVEEFKEYLREGSEAFLSFNFRRAAESYKAARERVGPILSDFEIDDQQFHLIKYLQSAALVNIGTYEDIVKAIQLLCEMEVYEYSIPALHVQLARAYCKLNRFKNAVESIDKVTSIIDSRLLFPPFKLPMIDETIPETTNTGLEDAVKELNQICRIPCKPSAICRYDTCLKMNPHVLPSECIYVSDPDFVGFVRMICEEKCHIEFHLSCWKLYKEYVKGVSKVNDKDLLGHPCPTTDCVNCGGRQSFITVIEIISADGEAKSVIKMESKQYSDGKKIKRRRCKLDDKDTNGKQTKNKDKKHQEGKKHMLLVDESDEESDEEPIMDESTFEEQMERLEKIRTFKFGAPDSWDPSQSYYGRPSEREKWEEKCENDSTTVQYLDYSKNESVDVKDAKEFIFSYFMEILKVEGKLKVSDVTDLWEQVAQDFCNIKLVLPDLKDMCELLLESTCFCQIEDYICLAGQLEGTHANVATALSETVQFLLDENEQVMSAMAEGSLNTCNRDQMSCLSSDEDLSYSEDDYFNNDDDSSEEISDEYEEDTNDINDDYLCDMQKLLAEDYHIETTTKDDSKLNEEMQSSIAVGEVSIQTQSSGAISERSVQAQSSIVVTELSMQIQSSIGFTDPSLQTQSSKVVTETTFSMQSMLDEMDRVKNMILQVNSSTSSPDKSNTTDLQDNKDCYNTEIINSSKMVPDKIELYFADNKADPTCVTQKNVGSDISLFECENCDENNHSQVEQGDKKNDESSTNLKERKTILLDKSSQSKVETEERSIQTLSKETKCKQSQTKASDEFKELNQKLTEETKRTKTLSIENAKLKLESTEKESFITNLAKMLEKELRARANMEKQLDNFVATLKNKDAEWKKRTEVMDREISCIKEHSNIKEQECQRLSKESTKLINQNKALEMKMESLEKTVSLKVLNAQKAQLLTTKAFWESQVNLLGKRCVEKISEMHSWFSLLPSGDVENLPSWKDVRQITLQWGEISSKLQIIQVEFQMKCNSLETKLAWGEEVDLSSLTLPALPEEPRPLPLDKIHKEITEKQVRKITELTQLVANQQLDIEKCKEFAKKQIQQMMSAFQTVPRSQTPLTTAFGNLALHYAYPQAQTLDLSSFGSSNLPIPPNPDMSNIGAASKPLQVNVQTLLQESSTANFSSNPEKPYENVNDQQLPLVSSFLGLTPPSLVPPPRVIPPSVSIPTSLPTTPVKVKSTPRSAKKEKKAETVLPKGEVPQAAPTREMTPVPLTTPPIPTAEKSKKKKKNKGERLVLEPRPSSPVPTHVTDEVDDAPWFIAVNKKNIPKPVPQLATQIPETKLKNKKKLLEKLQLKFPTTPLKELDEVVKLVREQNNGSLSGLPFDEIETRVEMYIKRKHFQKSSTMGLVKFTEAAWGPVKQQEAVTWSNMQLEECTICLEPMGMNRTKVDCNHEFHTKCLRKWLKEKSVCPLCNKFTTMSDEFPAL